MGPRTTTPSPPLILAGTGIESLDLAEALERRGCTLRPASAPIDGPVIHLATPRGRSPKAESGTDELLDAASAGRAQVVTVSTVLVYGECGATTRSEDGPFFPSANFRWCLDLERSLLAAGGNVVRVGLVHGGRAGELARRIQLARELGVSRWIGNGTDEFPTIHVDELADLCLRALRTNARGLACAATTGTVQRRRLAEAVADVAGVPAAAWPIYQAVATEGLDELEDVTTVRVASTRAAEELGWTPQAHDVIDELATLTRASRHTARR